MLKSNMGLWTILNMVHNGCHITLFQSKNWFLMRMCRVSARGRLYSGKLTKVLNPLDALVDWERRNRMRGLIRLMRVFAQDPQALLNRLNLEHLSFIAVHVSRSKRMGGVCSLIAAGLREEHEAVHACSHVERFNERIRVKGALIDDNKLTEALTLALDAREISPILDKTN